MSNNETSDTATHVKPKEHVVYTELIDASVITETDGDDGGRKIMFGDKVDRWVPKVHCYVTTDGRVYIARWLARKERTMWNGIFVEGSQMTRMRPYSHPARNEIENLITVLQGFIDKLRSLT